jgi:hypothetical protein
MCFFCMLCVSVFFLCVFAFHFLFVLFILYVCLCHSMSFLYILIVCSFLCSLQTYIIVCLCARIFFCMIFLKQCFST